MRAWAGRVVAEASRWWWQLMASEEPPPQVELARTGLDHPPSKAAEDELIKSPLRGVSE